MTEIYTRKHFCGHWTDDDLVRTLDFKRSQLARMRRSLAEMERDIAWIEEERAERAA